MTRSERAFTLVEVLVALAIFGMLAALAYGTLSQTLSNADILTARMERLQAVQRTWRALGQDFLQLAPRPVRDELGDNYVPALRTDRDGNDVVELTHGGWSNPAGLPRGSLQRVAYRLERGELIRYYWTVLDRTFDNEPRGQVLLDGVDSIQMRFMQDNGDWIEEWPARDTLGPPALRLRPRAVEIVLTLDDETEMSRLLEVAP